MDLIGFVITVGVPGYFVLQARALYAWRGGWLIAAALPVAPMGAVVVYTVYAFNQGSNLFPLVLIFTAPVAFFYLLILLGLRRLSRRRPEAAGG